jgi:hypothetical protein
VYEFHWIGRRERECPRQHLVEDDAHRVQIAPRIDRPIHPPRLLRRHVRERPGDELRRGRRLTLTWHTRGDPKACQPDLITAGIDQSVRGLDVFVNQLTLMHMFECRGETERNPEESRYRDPSVEKSVERVSSRIAEDKRLLTVVV